MLAGLILKEVHFLWIALLLFISDSQAHFTGVSHTSKAGGGKRVADESVLRNKVLAIFKG